MKGYVFIAGKDIGAYPATVAGVARSASRLQQDDTQDRYEGRGTSAPRCCRAPAYNEQTLLYERPMKRQPCNLGFLVADIARLMRRTYRQRQQRSELTVAQARTLVHVARREGVRQVDLAETLEVQPITLARLIDQLARAGLVERRPDPTDRRAYLVYLTRAAGPQLSAIEDVAASIRADALRGLDAREAALVIDALQKIHANLAGG
jgi:DNA-binding MarR family transcriptional regulator